MTAIAAVVLIFAFVARESLPLIFSHEVHKEVTLRQMWTRSSGPAYDAASTSGSRCPTSRSTASAAADRTIKVTLVAMMFGVPLGVGAALYVSQLPRPRVPRGREAGGRVLAAFFRGAGVLRLMVMATWMQDTFVMESRLNAIVAGLALSFAIIRSLQISEEAFGPCRAATSRPCGAGSRPLADDTRGAAGPVPASRRGGPGSGRAGGETMIVLMASGNAAILSACSRNRCGRCRRRLAASAEVVFGGAHYTVLFYLGPCCSCDIRGQFRGRLDHQPHEAAPGVSS